VKPPAEMLSEIGTATQMLRDGGTPGMVATWLEHNGIPERLRKEIVACALKAIHRRERLQAFAITVGGLVVIATGACIYFLLANMGFWAVKIPAGLAMAGLLMVGHGCYNVFRARE